MFQGMKKLSLSMLMATVLVSGCQTVPQGSSEPVLDNRTFMNLWSTYQRCVSGSNLDQLRADVEALRAAPQSRTSRSDFTVPLPDMILRHVSAQPTRVAADPKAMTAACSLHVAQVALESGKDEVAVELLNGLLRTHSSGEYGYYVQQAKATLHRVQPTAVYVRQPGDARSVYGQVVSAPAANVPSTPSPDLSDNRQYE